MLDRPSPAEPGVVGQGVAPDRRWPYTTIACAGLIGAAGVIVAAAGAHTGGGDLARTASEFLLVHAAAILAASGVALAVGRTSAFLVAALGLLSVGAVLFGGDLALAGLLDWRPMPLAAPTGGLCLIAGWLSLSAAAVRLGLGGR